MHITFTENMNFPGSLLLLLLPLLLLLLLSPDLVSLVSL